VTAPTPEPTPWPPLDAPGLYRAQCTGCDLTKTGTVAELRHFRRLHSDPPNHKHVVRIANDGKRTDT
jgi:hypothetical protein